MSYLTFHLYFTLPPIILLTLTLPTSFREFGGWRAQIALPLIAGIAFTYTTPWDNFLVANSVWWYGPDDVIGTIGVVPIEEYGFFLLQPMLTGLFCFHYLIRNPSPTSDAGAVSSWLGFALFSVLTLTGLYLLWGDVGGGLYMGLILAWAPPLLAGMWLYDGETLWSRRDVLLYAVGIPTIYLWGIDGLAIRFEVWTISEQYTLGFAPLGLPVEEATFFLMTNLLVVKGILLLLYGSHASLVSSQISQAGPPTKATDVLQAN